MATDERILKNYNLNLLKSCTFAGTFQMPKVGAYSGELPVKLKPFHETIHRKQVLMHIGDRSKCVNKEFVHFFLDDYQFERLWNAPERYLTTLCSYAGVLSPDFSLYRDMPLAMQIWNTYRNRVLAGWMQQHGIGVIPTVSWSDSSSYNFCFDGLPKYGTFAISTVGAQKNRNARRLFRDGFREFMRRCMPDTLVVYGEPLQVIDNTPGWMLNIHYYPNSNLQRMRNYGR